MQPVIREDGARKKRIIDAGPADEPTTPTPAPRARSQMMRRGRVTIAPTSPSIWSPFPRPIKVETPTSSEVAPESPDIWVSATPPLPSLAQLDGLSETPHSPDTLLATPSPAKDAGGLFSCTTPPWLASLLAKKAASPSSAAPVETAQDDSDEDLDMDADEDIDDSIDWSFAEAWHSPVPKDRPQDYLQQSPSSPAITPVAGSPVAAPSPEIAISQGIASPAATLAPFTSIMMVPQSPAAMPQQLRGPHQISPNTHFNIIRKASVTPMRKMLLKRQVTAQAALEDSMSEAGNHNVPSPSMHTPQRTDLQQKVYEASMLKMHALDIANRAREASERYRAEAEARQNINSEISPAEQEYFNFVDTVDQDLSFLSDAYDDDDDDEAAQTLHSPEPAAPRQRSVRWSSHATAKPFYCDEKIADMLDSTLETIHSSPIRANVTDHFSEDDTSEDEATNVSDVSRSPSNAASSTEHAAASNESVGFTGVPSSTWDDSDDSLEESQISLELLGDLQKELQEKLALAPPPPPVKAFVTPLSSEEQDKLDAAAKKTDNGKHATMWVVHEKLHARDFSTLLPREFNGDPKAWLNDNIVNEYLGILIAAKKKGDGFEHKRGGPAPAVHAFSSFWYPTIKKANNTNGVARWAARFQLAGRQYLDATLLLYPICDKGHWRLLAVKPQERTIEYLDSLGWEGSAYLETMKEYLARELGNLWNEDEWTVLEKQRSTRQVNGSDCGVFTILNALALLRGDEFVKVLACDGMLDARERIAITLMAGVPTSEFD